MMFDAKLWIRTWKCPPQLRQLPRDSHIDATCRACRSQWTESVRELVEDRRLGARYLDLHELESRCACGGRVRLSIDSQDGASQDEDEYDLLQAA